MTGWIRAHKWPALISAIAVAMLTTGAIVFAAGSGDSDSSAEAADGFQAFQNCLEEHGVDAPVPPSGDAGAPPQGGDFPDGGAPPDSSGAPPQGAPFGDADQEAFQACGDLMPSPPDGGFPQGGAPPQGAPPLPDN